MVEEIKSDWAAKIITLFFLIISMWWVALFLSGVKETFQNYLFGATYGLVALWGGIWGLAISKKWGGFSSVMGKAIIFLSLGLLSQEFGQLVFSYYNIFLHVEIPYPSIADFGFFGTIPFYIIGIFLLAKASGATFSLNKIRNQIQSVGIPLIMLVVSYLVFLKDYKVDFSDPIKLFLDFGYPLGEAFYISLAILTYSLSRNLLGGIMRNKILFLLVAFVLEYVADFNFLYQNNQTTWVNGGYGDYIYLLSYFVMALGLIQLKNVFRRLG